MAKRKPASKTKRPSRTASRTASRKAKSSTKSTKSTKAKGTKKAKSAGDEEVTIDRRRSARRAEDRGESPETAPAKMERRKKVVRRRQIDPTTCERDYSNDEIEFMNALDDYKRASGRMFPTCSEVLEVVRSLGYVKLSASEMVARTAADESESTPDLAAAPVAGAETAVESQP